MRADKFVDVKKQLSAQVAEIRAQTARVRALDSCYDEVKAQGATERAWSLLRLRRELVVELLEMQRDICEEIRTLVESGDAYIADDTE